MTSDHRTLPYDLAAERATLGAILVEAEAIGRVADVLRPEHFGLERHAAVYRAALACYERGTPPDLLTVRSELSAHGQLAAVGGDLALGDLAAEVVDPYRIAHYARSVYHCARLRRLAETGGRIAALGYDAARPLDETVEDAERLLYAATRDDRAGDGYLSLSHVARGRAAAYSAVLDGEAEPPGVRTGLRDLDELLGGLRPGQLVTIGARPRTGKTALGLTIARNIARTGQHVGFVSLEMSREELADRLVAMETGIPLHLITAYRVPDPAAYFAAIGQVEQWPMSIDDGAGQTLTTIRARARQLHAIAPLSVLVVDYLQLVAFASGMEGNENAALTVISKGLKTLARELRVPVVALAQLSRAVEIRASHVPQLSDLRGSGSIEQDSDVVIFIYREELYDKETDRKGVAELHVAKVRNGPTGVVPTYFEARTTSFKDLDRYHPAEGY